MCKKAIPPLIISYILFSGLSCARNVDSLNQIQADYEAVHEDAHDDVFVNLSRRCAKSVESTTDKTEALEAVKLIFNISKGKPLKGVGKSLAMAIDRYVSRFDADDLNTWQPVFGFLWYNMRGSSYDNTRQEQIQVVTENKNYLAALYEQAESKNLKAVALYVKNENRLLFERELGVLTNAEREEAIHDVKTLLDQYGSLIKPHKKRLEWEKPYQYYATGQLSEIERLHVGAIAPDIEGKDLDGVPFKVSDYRGRVVVLNFWGAWCAPCIAVIPKERELVERLKDAPFVLLGVNTDSELQNAKTAVEKHQVPWRSFWNGPSGWEGNIVYDWFVQGYPLYYVLDGEGRIHFKSRSYEGLEEMVDKLLSEVQSKSATK